MTRPTPERQLLAVVATIERLAGEVIDRRHALELRAHAYDLTKLAGAISPALPPNALTPAQANVLEFVRRYTAEYGQPPTRKEIADAFCFASTNAAQDHLRALERKGHLTLTGAYRGIRLTPVSPPSSKAHP